MLDTRVIDDHERYKLSKAKATATQVGTPPAFASIDLSPDKSGKKARSKSCEDEGTMTISLPADGSTYSDPSFVKDMTEVLL